MVHILNVFFIEIEGILINYDTNVIIGTVYRPPATAIKEFNESMSLLLVKVQNVGIYNACYKPTEHW